MDAMIAHANRLTDRLSERARIVQKQEDYFRGKQPLAYASDEWRKFNAERFRNFSDNWCGVVASSAAERIRLTGVQIGDDTDVFSDDEKALMRYWDEDELDAQSSQGFLHSIVAARSFALVWPGEGVSWERADQVIVDYEPGFRQRARLGLKCWEDDKDEYVNLFDSEYVYKLRRSKKQAAEFANKGEYVDTNFGNRNSTQITVQSAGAWEPRELPDEPWPLANPFGVVPIVEIPNRPMLGADPMSDIAGTMAMQDAINLLWAYLFAAADFASMPARVVMGQEPPKVPILDTSGNIIGEKPVDIDELKQGRLLWLTGQETSINQWESAKLDVFTDVILRCVRHIAAQTRTPIHAFGELQNINGETLLATETGLVKKVEEFHLFASGAMRRIFHLRALADNDEQLAQAALRAKILWADPQVRTQAQASDAALKDRQAGFPWAWVAKNRYGLSQAEIERYGAMRIQEADDAIGSQVAALGFGKQGVE